MTTLKGAIIGYGKAAETNHVPAYLKRIEEKKDIEIIAIADTCDARRQIVQQHLPSVRVYTDFEILLDEESDNLNFIDIATPPLYQFRIAKSALERNLHVLSELPISVKSSELLELINTAKEKKCTLFPSQLYRYSPVTQKICSLIESTSRITGLTINHFVTEPRKGVSEWKPEWRKDVRYGGDIFIDNYHLLYLSCIFMRSYPISLSARINKSSVASVFLIFPNGFSQIFLNLNAGINKTIYTLHGVNGAILFEDDKIYLTSPKGQTLVHTLKELPSSFEEAHLFYKVIDEFISTITTSNYINSITTDSYISLSITEKIHESNSLGSREVSLENIAY